MGPMLENANTLLSSAKPWSLYYRLFLDILSSFKRRCSYFYGLELVSLITQMLIALVFLLLFRKLGIDNTAEIENLNGGYRALLGVWAQKLSMGQILTGLILCLSFNAFTSFAATRIINTIGRDYEDKNVQKAFEFFSGMSLSNFISINKLFPFNDRSAVQLIQSDVRMTAISARQLVRGSFSIVLTLTLLWIFALIDIRIFFGMLAFLVISIFPMAYFFRAGMIHSFELLGYAPLMTKAKRALFEKAISRGRSFSAKDAEFLEAYDNKNGRIKKYMDEFEYRFQLINNGALTFDGFAKAATILMVFAAVIMVGLKQIDYSLFILIILILNLSISAYKGIMAVTSSISRYFVHVVKFRLFLETCDEQYDAEKTTSVSPYYSSFLPQDYPLLLDLEQKDVYLRNLKRGETYALMITGPINKLKSFSIYQNLFQTPEINAWVLDHAGYVNDNLAPNTADLFSFLELDPNLITKYYQDFVEKLKRVIDPSFMIPLAPEADWSSFFQKDAHQIVVKILGSYVFLGRILFVNAELVVLLEESMRKRLFAEFTEGLTFLTDRRAKPNLSQLKEFYDNVILFDGDTSTIMSQGRLYTMTHGEIMEYIKKTAAGPLGAGLSIADTDESEISEIG